VRLPAVLVDAENFKIVLKKINDIAPVAASGV
jgi:hypothetical protein